MSTISNIITRALAPVWGSPKSLNDVSVDGVGIGSATGLITTVRTGTGGTARLFKKRNVPTLRRYAEYSFAVRAALNIYRDTISQAQWQIIPADPAKPCNEKVKARIEGLLKTPNRTGKRYSVFQEEFVEDYLVVGHGGIEKAIRRNGEPYALYMLNAANLAFLPDWDGDPSMPRYAEIEPSGTFKRWIPDQMAMALVNCSRSYDTLGLSHVEILDLAVRALLEGDDYLLRSVSDIVPAGALDLGEGYTKEQIDALRAEIQNLRQQFLLLSNKGNAKFIPFTASEREMRLLDKSLWFVRQVCAIFQLPTAVMGQLVDASRANTESLLTNADKGPGALLWRIKEMEQSQIVEKFGPVEEHNCQIDYPIMSRRDEKQQADISSVQIGGRAWSSTNDARRASGQPAIELPIADEVLIDTPSGPVPLSALNAQYFDGDKLKEPEEPKEPDNAGAANSDKQDEQGQQGDLNDTNDTPDKKEVS